MKFHILISIVCCVLRRSDAQGLDNQGTDFIIGFMNNQGTSNPLELFITTTSNTAANVNITTPAFDSSFLTSITVSRGSIEKVTLTNTLRGSDIELSNKAVRITSSEEVTVYGVNKEQYSTDGFVALPVDTLGTEYIAVTWTDEAELMVIATEDNTQVSMTFPASSPGVAISITILSSSYGNGDTMNFTLNKYDTLHLYQDGADFTGTKILSDKPVAVMSGNKKVKVTDTGTSTSSDHLVEQLLPVDAWGKDFFTISTPDRTLGDYFRVIAAEDSTFISTQSLGSSSINSGEYVEYNVPTGTYEAITASKPVTVVMFGKTIGSPADGINGGDPQMSVFPPINQFPSDYTWSTVQTPTGDFTNYLVVVIKDSLKADLYLDNTQVVGATWSNISGTSPLLVTATFNVNPGSHSIYHSNPASTFMGIAFGNAQTNSYAYAAGMRVAKINAVCVPSATVAGDIVDNDCDGWIDEEENNGIDDDNDGLIDEDLATPPRIDGNWAAWGSWGTCSISCGGGSGTQWRSRTCTDPAPANNGLDCTGSGSDSQACSTSSPCPIDGDWGSWGNWSSCSVTCDVGTYTRTRSCDNPTPQYGGANCTGSDEDSGSCWGGTCYPSVLGNLDLNCTRTYFGCKTGSMTCIDFSFRCDGTADCDDGSDESVSIAGCDISCSGADAQKLSVVLLPSALMIIVITIIQKV